MKNRFLLVPLMALSVACSQQSQIQPIKALGSVDLSLGSDVSTRATLITNESTLAFTRLSTSTITDLKRNTRFISATFKVTNNTGAALNNLTLYALNLTGNLGNTAFKSIANFSGSGLTDVNYVRAAQPGHKMNAATSAGGAATVDVSNSNFQLFTPAEASALGATNGTVLEYGYRMNENSIASGADGTFSIGYRLPISAANTDATSFVVSFAVVNDGPSRVSQSAEENPYSVGTRGVSAAATEIAYFGPTASMASIPGNTGALTTVVYPAINPKTAVGVTPVYLFNNSIFASYFYGLSYTTAGFSGAQARADDFGSSFGFAGAACVVGVGTAGSNLCNPVVSSSATMGNATGAVGNNGYQGIAAQIPYEKDFSKYGSIKLNIDYTGDTNTGSFLKMAAPGDKVVCFTLTSAPVTGIQTITFASATPFNCAVDAQVDTAYTTVLGHLSTIILQVGNSATATTLNLGTVTFSDFQP